MLECGFSTFYPICFATRVGLGKLPRCRISAYLLDPLKGHAEGHPQSPARFAASCLMPPCSPGEETSRAGLSTEAPLEIPEVNVGGIWLVAGVSPDQRRWVLIGDLRTGPEATYFDHPEPATGAAGA